MQLPTGMYRICSEIRAIFGVSGARHITSAGALRHIIGSKNNQEHFNDKSQQDAVDFMQVLLSNIEAEVGCQTGEAGARAAGDHRDNCVVSLIQGVERFQNMFKNSSDGSCPMCGEVPRSREVKFEIFHLSNDDKSKAISIQELLDDNLTLPSDVLKMRCSQCDYGQDQDAITMKSISKLPQVLLLNVPKFEFQKHNKRVIKVPTKSVVTDEYVIVNNQRFKLFGVLDHQGTSQHSGHWLTWARCREAPGGWLRCDDSSVEPATLEKVLNQDNYILAYQKHVESNRSSPVKHNESNRSPPARSTSKLNVSESKLNSPMKSSKISTLGNQCMTCGKTFTRLLQHLRMKASCQHSYDMDAIEKDQASRQRQNKTENQNLKRKLYSPDKKENIRDKDKAAHKKRRDNETKEEKDLIREKDNSAHKKSRDSRASDEIVEDREKNRELKAKSRDRRNSDEIEEDRKKAKMGMANYRDQRNSDEIEEDREKNRELKAKSRDRRNSDEIEEDRKKAKMGMANYRDQRNSDEIEEDREKNRELKAMSRDRRNSDEIEEDRNKAKMGMANYRDKRNSDKIEEDREKNRELKAKSRDKRNSDEIEEDRKKTKEETAKYRDNMTPEEIEKTKEKNRKAQAERRKILQNNPAYRKSVAMAKADYRSRLFKKHNESIFGRRRCFIESVRNGPCYPCISCHRLLFNVSVVEIRDLQKFREDVNECYDNIFEKTIHARTPANKNRYYICSTCKAHIFRGSKPPMSAMNNLEVFDNSCHEELRLTELEASMIAKTLFFMKIFKLPRSAMSAVKDRCVCVPIDESTINKTLNMLPRTPNEAGLIPVKW